MHGQLYSPGFVASMLSSNPGIGRFLTDERVRSTLDRIPVVAFWSVGITPVLLHKTASSGVESVDSANSRALEVLKSYLQDTLGYPVDDTEREYLPGPYIPPHLLRAFPGALMWTRMPWYMRIPAHLGLGVEQVEMAEESEKRGEKVVGVWVGEAPLDVKKDYVWTDWDEVDAYAGAIVREAAERGQVRG